MSTTGRYYRDATDFMHSVVDLSWAQAFRRTHNGRGPFSLVYMDYTSSEQWPADMDLLFKQRLFIPGAILAVTCPARAEHVPPAQDRHLASEAAHEVQIGGKVVLLEGDLAGLAKLEVTLRGNSSHTHATCLESFAYTSRKTRMWVAIYQIGLPDTTDWFDRQNVGTTASDEKMRNEQIANLYVGGQGFALEKGPAATTLEGELQEQLRPQACTRELSFAVQERLERLRLLGRELDYRRAESRAISMAGERQRREERREWDFLVSVYSSTRKDGTSWFPSTRQKMRMIFHIFMPWTAKRSSFTKSPTTWTLLSSKGACLQSMP